MASERKPKPITKKWDRQCTFIIRHDMQRQPRREPERCKALTGHNYFFCQQHLPARQEHE